MISGVSNPQLLSCDIFPLRLTCNEVPANPVIQVGWGVFDFELEWDADTWPGFEQKYRQMVQLWVGKWQFC